MYNSYNQRKETNNISTGSVVQSTNEKTRVFSNIPLENIRQALPYGYYSKPYKGDNVMVVKTDNGEFILNGVLNNEKTLSAGEVMITSSGGAYIKLRTDGKVEINGMLISKSGEIE